MRVHKQVSFTQADLVKFTEGTDNQEFDVVDFVKQNS